MLVERRELPQRWRYENATGAIERYIISVTNEQTLKAANAFVEARELHESLLDRLPLGQRIKQQTVTGVGGQNEPAVAVMGKRFAVPGRYRQASLAVQCEMGDPSKHCFSSQGATLR